MADDLASEEAILRMLAADFQAEEQLQNYDIGDWESNASADEEAEANESNEVGERDVEREEEGEPGAEFEEDEEYFSEDEDIENDENDEDEADAASDEDERNTALERATGASEGASSTYEDAPTWQHVEGETRIAESLRQLNVGNHDSVPTTQDNAIDDYSEDDSPYDPSTDWGHDPPRHTHRTSSAAHQQTSADPSNSVDAPTDSRAVPGINVNKATASPSKASATAAPSSGSHDTGSSAASRHTAGTMDPTQDDITDSMDWNHDQPPTGPPVPEMLSSRRGSIPQRRPLDITPPSSTEHKRPRQADGGPARSNGQSSHHPASGQQGIKVGSLAPPSRAARPDRHTSRDLIYPTLNPQDLDLDLSSPYLNSAIHDENTPGQQNGIHDPRGRPGQPGRPRPVQGSTYPTQIAQGLNRPAHNNSSLGADLVRTDAVPGLTHEHSRQVQTARSRRNALVQPPSQRNGQPPRIDRADILRDLPPHVRSSELSTNAQLPTRAQPGPPHAQQRKLPTATFGGTDMTRQRRNAVVSDRPTDLEPKPLHRIPTPDILDRDYDGPGAGADPDNFDPITGQRYSKEMYEGVEHTVINIPWGGKPGWVERDLDESYDGDLSTRGRGGRFISHRERREQEQRRKDEATPADIVIGENETADSIIMDIIKKESRAKKGKGRAKGR